MKPFHQAGTEFQNMGTALLGMMKDQHGMMAHMMEHMQAGKDSMTMCPMMKH